MAAATASCNNRNGKTRALPFNWSPYWRWPLAIAVCAIYCGNYVLIINARLTARQATSSPDSSSSKWSTPRRKYWLPKAQTSAGSGLVIISLVLKTGSAWWGRNSARPQLGNALIKQSFIKKYSLILLYPPVYFFLSLPYARKALGVSKELP